jgi:hypothetical protein
MDFERGAPGGHRLLSPHGRWGCPPLTSWPPRSFLAWLGIAPSSRMRAAARPVPPRIPNLQGSHTIPQTQSSRAIPSYAAEEDTDKTDAPDADRSADDPGRRVSTLDR